ncbi:hypothetical protein [Hyalangium sp.]|uniref:hypothetical protein n=1 Tax=Hyalangium sp. TaxID=2028555 RepID=UPI002D36F786|nr:hypothetical protein [Hyalangium sp.]HYI02506.1 hypothetical protein [Hyalangium sp.]
MVALAALALLAGCAPATLSPMVMRLGPGHPQESLIHAGLRSGPRMSAPLAAQTSFDPAEQNFSGDRASFSPRQWSVSYDFAVQKPLDEKLALHLGLNGEIYYPLPLPGYGVYVGLSSWYGTPTLGIAPSIVLRGATDFGLDTRGGPGSIIGAETSVALYFSPEDRVSVGVVPFLGIHQVFASQGLNATTLHYGGALVMRLPLGKADQIEMSGGSGRVKASGAEGWNAPILGVRWGR